jgi:uncharacterized protein (TIGR02284 family)
MFNKKIIMVNINQNNNEPIYHLIAILEDTKRVYLRAAEKIKDEVLSVLLERFGYQRGRYSKELQQLLHQSGASSSIDQFTLSLLYRSWMHLKAAFKFGQREAVIDACIKGEEAALENYTLALQQLQDNDEVKMLLMQQANGVTTVLNTIKEFTGKTSNGI